MRNLNIKADCNYYAFIAGLFVLLLIVGILWHNNSWKKAYTLLQTQKQETDFKK